MTERPTMGAYLRSARRRRRVSIDRAAEETRIRSDFLMRMESDEFDFLAPAYVRGFLKNYARFLRVDPDPLLEEFDMKWGGGRVDAAQIVALERRNKQTAPRERREISNWTIAAVFAGALLVLFGVVGLIAGPQDERPQRDTVAGRDERRDDDRRTPTQSPTATPTPSATPTPTPSETDLSLALSQGMELEIAATSGRCWVDVTADGVNVFTGTLELGDTETFTATESMDVVLGDADSVDLVLNERAIGSPGVDGVFTFKLPDDVESL